jgi:hypothetical protein
MGGSSTLHVMAALFKELIGTHLGLITSIQLKVCPVLWTIRLLMPRGLEVNTQGLLQPSYSNNVS